jgi:hypothetical protein
MLGDKASMAAKVTTHATLVSEATMVSKVIVAYPMKLFHQCGPRM